MEFKFLSTRLVINIIYKHDRKPEFDYLYNHIINNDEIEIDENGNPCILFYNKKNLNDNVYTNILEDNKYQWLGIYDNGNLVSLQLIGIYDEYIELIVVQKSKKHNVHNVFCNIIDFVKNTYHKDITTFPLNDTLKEHYKKFGFVETEENTLILKII